MYVCINLSIIYSPIYYLSIYISPSPYTCTYTHAHAHIYIQTIYPRPPCKILARERVVFGGWVEEERRGSLESSFFPGDYRATMPSHARLMVSPSHCTVFAINGQFESTEH